ncbi:hypothetical protein [Glycomyces xiaoerkulensis]|uniref:hypothetical protein n=1 Tax=Glycomyces xiaoerkulensis TaxID=2038139 RepID=UPI000C2667FB|nr:hypothetical protein [Glycomyces xiaoerkulensis]
MEPTLERAIGRVVEGTRHWSPARWSSGGNAEAMHALVQALADLDAEAEGEPRREVPRLASDLHLPDQLQVIGLDLLDVADRLTPDQQSRIEEVIREARQTLFRP